MTSSSTSTFKQWETPERTRITGEPPGPDVTVSHTQRGEVRRQDIRAINPLYKTGPVTGFTNGIGGSGSSIHVTRESKIEPSGYYETPDYKVEREQESYRLQIIDPKAPGHSTPFYASSTLPSSFRKDKTPDFPSQHSHRSFLKLNRLEPRKIRSMETKHITPHDYLFESLERHRQVSMSPLRENLRVNERDVNQPWNAARRPGPKEREPLKEFITLKPPTTRPPSQSTTTTASWQFASGGGAGTFSPKSVVSVNGHQRASSSPGLLKVRTDLLSPTVVKPEIYVTTSDRSAAAVTQPYSQITYVPAVPLLVPVSYEVREESKSNVEYERKGRRYFDDYGDSGKGGSTLIRVEDEYRRPKPKSIMKQLQKEYASEDTWSDRRTGSPSYKYEGVTYGGPRGGAGGGFEQTNTVEETKKTEEVERKVRSSSDKRRGGRGQRHRDTVGYYDNDPYYGRNIAVCPAPPPWRDSPNRGYRGEHRSRDDYYTEHDRSRQQHRGNFHKTYSSRDVYGPEEDFYTYGSTGRGGASGTGGGPIVEFPPTLPRSEAAYSSERNVSRGGRSHHHRHNKENVGPHQTHHPDWHVEPYFYREAWLMDKQNGDTTGLEREFRQSAQAPLPHGQNVNEREFREEKIPGGQESFSREVKAQAGTRGDNTQFSESKQELHFKREQTSDNRYPY